MILDIMYSLELTVGYPNLKHDTRYYEFIRTDSRLSEPEINNNMILDIMYSLELTVGYLNLK